MTLPDLTGFVQRPCVIAGDECLLIYPEVMGVDWREETLEYRSVIVRVKDGKRISCGFPKYFNLGEKPLLYTDPNLYSDWVIEEKLDGSLCLISSSNGQLIIRTCGTVSAFDHDSSDELKSLLAANSLITDNPWVESGEWTLLFEHLSVTNQIILKHTVPSLVLIGAVKHDTYWMANEISLAIIAKAIGVKRPKRFIFNSLSKMVTLCESLEGTEGFVLSYAGNQHRVKIKTAHYLRLHRMKSALASFDKVLDLYLSLDLPSYDVFYAYIEKTFDYELAEYAAPVMRDVCYWGEFANVKLLQLTAFVFIFAGRPRKETALAIIERWKPSGLDSYAFTIMNGKTITTKQRKQLIEHLKASTS